MRFLILALPLLLSGCLAGHVSYSYTVTSTSERSGNFTAEQAPEPVSVHESFDLAAGGQHDYSFKVERGATAAHATVYITGPVEEAGYSPHGVGGTCVTYSREDYFENGYSNERGNHGNCGGAVSVGSENLMRNVLLDWDMSDALRGDYSFSIKSDPQFGSLYVDIVVDY